MKSYPTTMNVKVAAPHRSKINLSGDVYSTSDFGILKPIFCREVLPNDIFNINISSFTRLAPMPVPPFANINMFNRCFYVRMRNIWRGWTSFIKGAPDYENGITTVPTEVPSIGNNQLVTIFSTLANDLATRGEESSTLQSGNDFVSAYNGNQYNFKFTPKGKKFYDLLLSLGYSINFATSDTTRMSLLPLLAYIRVYFDYFIPEIGNYKNAFGLAVYFSRDVWDSASANQFIINVATNSSFFSYLDNDYFTSAWLNPLGPAATGLTSLISPKFTDESLGYDNSNPVTVEAHNAMGARIGNETATSGYIRDLSATGIKTVQALQNWLNRKMISGSMYYEYLRSTFGVHIPDAIINRSDYIGTQKVNIQISDVTSTASSDAGGVYQPIGEYAGKGIGYGENYKFNVKANEHGYVLILNNIVPHVGYYQGRNRELQHLGREDFFTPEFENVNTQAIRNDEIYAEYASQTEYSNGQSFGGKPDGIFGYSPRYSEYKKGLDFVTGDFRLRSLSGEDYNAWHLMRQFLPPSVNNPLSLGSRFMSAHPDINGNNFDRIFNYTASDSPDHFITIHHLDVEALRPMHSISDSIDTEGSETIQVQTNGSRL